MGVMEFAIVRNNIYRLLVTNISGLGSGTTEIDPEKPDEYEAYLKMDFNVLPWIVRNQGGTEAQPLNKYISFFGRTICFRQNKPKSPGYPGLFCMSFCVIIRTT